MSDDLKKAIEQAESMVKSRVKAHTRRTASGAVVQVKEHEDSRSAEKQVKYYIQKFSNKMQGSSIRTAKGWVKGIGDISEADREKVWAQISKNHYNGLGGKLYDAAKKSIDDAIDETEKLVKARVKSYQRTTASGKMVQVKEHTDSRQAAAQQAKKERPKAKPEESKGQGKPQQESKWPETAAAAQAATRAAEDHERKMDIKNNDAIYINAKLHRDAALKNLEAFYNDAGTDVGRNNYYKASGHLSRAVAKYTSIPGAEKTAANAITSVAESISKIANKHITEQRAASLDYGSGIHLLAAEQHMKAAHAHQTALSRNWEDEAASKEHGKKMKYHQEKAKEHGSKAKEIADITVKATDKARVLGDNAKSTEDHIAASVAHKQAANLNYDSEGRAEHEKMAKWHANKAKSGGKKEPNLKKHPRYNKDDYDYFKGKGYSNERIKEFWDAEHERATGNKKKEEKGAAETQIKNAGMNLARKAKKEGGPIATNENGTHFKNSWEKFRRENKIDENDRESFTAFRNGWRDGDSEEYRANIKRHGIK